MRKSTKIIATVIAVMLVITAMLVAIYAATAGNANISANVSWTAQAGVDLEFWANVVGGSENKEIAKTTITPTTTNTDANIVGDLSCNFTDTTDDGVNNPNAIKFTYYVRNKSLTPLNIRVIKTPAEAEESGTNAETHKPRVVLTSETDGTSTLTAVSSNSGYDLKAGDIFSYSVVLSLASGGKGTINADTGFGSAFDAGVTFNFNVGGDNNGTIVTSVDGASPTTVSSSTLAGQTLGEYLASKQTAEYSTGWFFDEGLSKVVTEDYLSQSFKESSSSSFYNKEASVSGLKFTLADDGNSYLVEGESSTSPSGDVVIPNMYNGKPVSGFVSGYGYFTTFKENATITSIVLPNTITKIEQYNFAYSDGLKSVTIPNSVKTIGSNAFYSCVSLEEINLPYGLESIGQGVFYLCTNLANLIIPNSVDSIGRFSFYGCSNLKEVTLSSQLKVLDIGLFQSCTELLSVTIPNEVTTISSQVFYCCDKLKSVTISENVTSISSLVFTFCPNLQNLKVDSKNPKYDSRNDCNAIVETSSDTLLYGCNNTVVPNNIKAIGVRAFMGCAGLESLTIPNATTSIGLYALTDCDGLSNIKVDSGNTVFDSRDNCNAIIETSTNTLIFGCKNTIIPQTVTSLKASAFASCENLTSITIPKSVTSLDVSVFRGCSKLSTIKVEEGNPKYDSRNNCNAIIETATNTLVSGCQSTIIPNTVTKIGSQAFQSCSSLTSITIPDSVTNIEAKAFYNSGLNAINIGKGVSSIGNELFTNCYNLTSITIDSQNSKYDSRDNCNAIIETSTNKLISGCQSTLIPNSIKTIGYRAFYNCTMLENISILGSVETIGEDAFSNCTNLVTVNLNSGLKMIDNGAFYLCRKLTKLELPNTLTTIIKNSFCYCISLKNLVIPESVTSVGAAAFAECSRLQNVTIFNLSSLESQTFFGCTNLTKIFIPISVITISGQSYTKSPFAYCSSNLKIYCEASEKPSGWGTYWNYYTSGKTLDVTWGVTRAEFDAL